ncbi:MAG: transcriptional regulator, AraC family [Bacteroidetes bacterium]|nr:transcriptional regulator, AraC family [Bacteroidota bacterium]
MLTLQEFYRTRLNFVPENLKKGLGHFNVFKRADVALCRSGQALYSRKDYYKISLLKGRFRIQYADKTVVSQKNTLVFSNPMIPYSWEPLGEDKGGFFCLFTEEFFNQYGQMKEYPVFKPGYNKVYDISDEKLERIEKLFIQMSEELNSDFEYKYDAIRGLVFSLVHEALKMQPSHETETTSSNAATRISTLFMELLERQFPIETPDHRVKLRSPIDFSEHLSIHVNHLNRSLKELTGKTTSQLIAERIAQEARMLLRHTSWNVSEIGFCLGFEEPAHFINFFRKNNNETPKAYRVRENI